MSEKRKYDSTVARIAGNIAGNMLDRVLVVHTPVGTGYHPDSMALIAHDSVFLARAIVAEVERTETRENVSENATTSQADKNR